MFLLPPNVKSTPFAGTISNKNKSANTVHCFQLRDIYDQKRACSCFCKCNLVWRECFSLAYWNDLSTEALSTCLCLFKAKVKRNITVLYLANGCCSVCFVTQEEELDSLREGIEAVDQNRPPLKVINGYSILDHLGTGAFGSVFKVKRQRWFGSVLLLCNLMPSSVLGFNDYTHMTGPKAEWPEPPGSEGGEPP